MIKTAKGNVKIYDTNEERLLTTINKGEKIPTERLNIYVNEYVPIYLSEDDYEEEVLLISMDNTEPNYECISSQLENMSNPDFDYTKLKDLGVDIEDTEFRVEKRNDFRIVYDTSEDIEINKKTIKSFLDDEYCESTSLAYGFFAFHIDDLVNCFGSTENVLEFFNSYLDDSLMRNRDEISDEVYEYAEKVKDELKKDCEEYDRILEMKKSGLSNFDILLDKISDDFKNEKLTKGQVVAKLYNCLLIDANYDVIEGNKPIIQAIEEGTLMKDFPEKMAKNYNENSKDACCLVFSSVLINYLNKLGIKTTLIGTQEDTGTRASFMYIDDDGLPYVANPVADVEKITERGIGKSHRRQYFVPENKNEIRFRFKNNSRIPLCKFEKEFGTMWSIGDFYSRENADRTFLEVSNEMKSKPISSEKIYRKLGRLEDYYNMINRTRIGGNKNNISVMPEEPLE